MGSSDSKVVDAQAGFESGMGTLLAVLSGANMVSGAGMLDYLRCQSFEKLVIDAEIIAAARRVAAGIEVRDNPIALDLMRKSGHAADYLSQPHTLKWFKQEMNIPSPVVDRGSLDAWQKAGSKDAFHRAQERVEQLVKKAPPSPLPEDVKRELTEIATTAARSHGMATLPSVL
jgi:trimethylamine--corrinoid protein Co-methyltransferase